jgi:hypothetical protein
MIPLKTLGFIHMLVQRCTLEQNQLIVAISITKLHSQVAR